MSGASLCLPAVSAAQTTVWQRLAARKLLCGSAIGSSNGSHHMPAVSNAAPAYCRSTSCCFCFLMFCFVPKTFLLNARSSCFIFLRVFFSFFFVFFSLFCKHFYLHFTCFFFFSSACFICLSMAVLLQLHLSGSYVLCVVFHYLLLLFLLLYYMLFLAIFTHPCNFFFSFCLPHFFARNMQFLHFLCCHIQQII